MNTDMIAWHAPIKTCWCSAICTMCFFFRSCRYALTASVAFPALALFNLLRFPIIMFPSQVQRCTIPLHAMTSSTWCYNPQCQLAGLSVVLAANPFSNRSSCPRPIHVKEAWKATAIYFHALVACLERRLCLKSCFIPYAHADHEPDPSARRIATHPKVHGRTRDGGTQQQCLHKVSQARSQSLMMVRIVYAN